MYCYKPRNFPASLSRTRRLSLYFYCLSPSQLGHKLHLTRGKNTGSTCLNTHGVVPPVLFLSCSACTGDYPVTALSTRAILSSDASSRSTKLNLKSQQSQQGHCTSKSDWVSGKVSLRKGQGNKISTVKLP